VILELLSCDQNASIEVKKFAALQPIGKRLLYFLIEIGDSTNAANKRTRTKFLRTRCNERLKTDHLKVARKIADIFLNHRNLFPNGEKRRLLLRIYSDCNNDFVKNSCSSSSNIAVTKSERVKRTCINRASIECRPKARSRFKTTGLSSFG
jgi:hypothetical protein